MKLKRGWAVLLLFFVLISLSACSKRPKNETTVMDVKDVIQITPETIVQTYEDKNGENKLCIDAEVEIPEIEEVVSATLTFDEGAANKMAESLIVTQYDDYSHPSANEWKVLDDSEKLRASFSIDTDRQVVSYIDFEADINGRDLDVNHANSYNYITQLIAPGMNNVSAQDAADKVCGYFAEYTELDFVPYRVLAGESTSEPEKGFYTLWAQGEYNGIPICPRLLNSPVGIGIYAWISGEKMFAFQNVFLLKVEKIDRVDSLIPLDAAVEKISENFSTFIPEGQRINIDTIKLEYFPVESSSGEYTLRPAWSFYGKGVDAFIEDWLFCYFADDGSFCYAGPLFY